MDDVQVEKNIRHLIENGASPLAVIATALSYLRDEHGSICNDDFIRITKYMLPD
jgi:Mg/Co/Ni transporter MgtE